MDKQQAVIYLTVLVVIEVLNFIFTIVSNQQGLIFLNLLRILLLVGAHCMKNVAWAAYYAIFALIATVYVFDPVGLWITGRKNTPNQMEMATQRLKMHSHWCSSWGVERQLWSGISTNRPWRRKFKRILLVMLTLQATLIQMNPVKEIAICIELPKTQTPNSHKPEDSSNLQVKGIPLPIDSQSNYNTMIASNPKQTFIISYIFFASYSGQIIICFRCGSPTKSPIILNYPAHSEAKSTIIAGSFTVATTSRPISSSVPRAVIFRTIK